MSQERVYQKKTDSQRIPEQTSEETQKVDETEVQRIKEETDELLSAIDAVLEENAQEFVNSYVQQGGE